jgi:hypothetical protein
MAPFEEQESQLQQATSPPPSSRTIYESLLSIALCSSSYMCIIACIRGYCASALLGSHRSPVLPVPGSIPCLFFRRIPGKLMGPNLYSRQLYGDLSLRAGTLTLLETIERFQFAAARILGLSGKLMGPVTRRCALKHKFAARKP